MSSRTWRLRSASPVLPVRWKWRTTLASTAKSFARCRPRLKNLETKLEKQRLRACSSVSRSRTRWRATRSCRAIRCTVPPSRGSCASTCTQRARTWFSRGARTPTPFFSTGAPRRFWTPSRPTRRRSRASSSTRRPTCSSPPQTTAQPSYGAQTAKENSKNRAFLRTTQLPSSTVPSTRAATTSSRPLRTHHGASGTLKPRAARPRYRRTKYRLATPKLPSTPTGLSWPQLQRTKPSEFSTSSSRKTSMISRAMQVTSRALRFRKTDTTLEALTRREWLRCGILEN
mmetsp:Transcript_12966/g.23523  ORF Transcript_12966/g.23523 Transcript_12966/m.23523 type:complete len:286 (-) Transcript_12966:430-1287(-)